MNGKKNDLKLKASKVIPTSLQKGLPINLSEKGETQKERWSRYSISMLK